MISKDEWHELKEKERLLKKSCELLRVDDKDLVKTIERFQKGLKSQ